MSLEEQSTFAGVVGRWPAFARNAEPSPKVTASAPIVPALLADSTG
jgi:hypothetical protein